MVRAIGRWSLAALMVNILIGSGIFGLPSKVAAMTGRQSPLVFLIAAAGIAVIAACFAEVASSFTQSGGAYLYTKVAFGRFVGLQTGWLNWLTRLTSTAAAVNLFTAGLAELWPKMKGPVPRIVAITLLLGVLTAINVRGIKLGTLVSNLFTASKLAPLVVFVLGGCAFLALRGSPVPKIPESYGTDVWLNAILLAIFAYTGFEAALIPAGEAKNPDRDAPVAILTALAICTPIYALVQLVVVQTVADPTKSESPLAVSAYVFGGRALATMIGITVLLSIVGYLAAGMIATPRVVFALAEQGDFPRWFARVHPRYMTPYISIVVFGVLVWTLAMLGSFSWNAKLASVSRLIIYALTCGALPTLRRKSPGTARFHLPWGTPLALAGIAFCVAVLSRVGKVELLVLAATLAIALINWLAVRRTSGQKVEGLQEAVGSPD